MNRIPSVQFDRFYTYDLLTGFPRAAAAAAPDWCRLASLTRTPEGRDVWLCTLADPATGPAETKPAYYVQANVHAQEMAATTAALHLIHSLLTDAATRETLRKVTFYVVPRVNPDGTEYALSACGRIRSRNRVVPCRNGIVPQDLDGDGLILNMRWPDPAGPYTEDPADPRLLVPRRPGDPGPFYQQFEEGLVPDYDGGPLVSAVKGFDFNRNYPGRWDPKTDASDYPFAHPEVRAVGEFMLRQHNIFGGIDFHCGAPAVFRPASVPDGDMNQGDLGLITELGRTGERLTGFPLMHVRDYREPWSKPIATPGDATDFAYFHLGVLFYVVELGNGYSSCGITTREYFAADAETREREFMRRIMRFADAHPDRDLFVAWHDVEHPQLGRVQVGGLKPAAIYHLYPPDLVAIAAGTTRFALAHARWAPQLALPPAECTRIADGVYRLRARVANVGRFSTTVMSTGAGARTAEPIRVSLLGVPDAQVVSSPRVFELDALPGGGGARNVEWFVTAAAGTVVDITAAHPRGGTVHEEVVLPQA